MGSTIFQLPNAFCDSAEAGAAASKKAMAGVKAHLRSLAKQKAFHKIRDTLKSKHPSVRAFTLVTQPSEDGQVECMNFIPLEYVDKAGVERSVTSEAEGRRRKGEPRMDALRDAILELPKRDLKALESKRVDCSNERALGVALIGADCYAAMEAEALERAAEAGSQAMDKPRL